MRIRTTSVSIAALVLWAACVLPSQSLPAQTSAKTWNLPQGTMVKDDGPRTYRFIVDINTAYTKGQMVHRQRLSGECTRGLAGGEVMWKNVTETDAVGATAAFLPIHRSTMVNVHWIKEASSLMGGRFERLHEGWQGHRLDRCG